ncbi:MAG: hypothetical protein AMDU4_FER2C00057G0057 [Ferroplasma sp. Type II]|jgi:molybdopterin-guanine dinucleotide biosynthesis protein B|uniref:molybdopterin-guanine dinucleotide biosynthesis protein B n=1 Tax=Ferroplasma sp. Type II TaxID=261388 RepID=UPI0003895532|nr:molybdopterin-guanine dinucleotide biosynthesis protein MobB [Ferroplasma sp. Type II]EQB73586.1 MAG: hypothetical protein AMDU4_FER2C00057G0057 [Ferroplasma sp. Type II]HIH60921.1 molybdopterin-guanine dinucleotide biosynthesis protein B [Ferroplasma sp.]HII81808.1 molybdopterin-guanine dinucleotide biosynthesis protein B [Ferroplasma sp.]
MKIFSFFGSSSSGKTTIISNIISQLSGSMTIGYVKNIPHDNISLDTEHKDTWQMENSGAYRIYGLAPGRTYSMLRRKTDIDDIITNDNDVDIYLIEGFRDYSKSTGFLVLGNEDYLTIHHDYIIKANNKTYTGECIKYPEEFSKIIGILMDA